MQDKSLTKPLSGVPRVAVRRRQQAQLPSMGEGAVKSLTPPTSKQDKRRAALAALEVKLVELTNQIATTLKTDRKDDIFDLLNKKKYRLLVQRGSGITVDQFSKMIQNELDTNLDKQQSHASWLADKTRTPSNPGGLYLHADTLRPENSDLFDHYNVFDPNMIWRFTSKPSEELVYITEGTEIGEITKVIADHSGGNDKRNPNVNTLSFARNVAALKGTAASFGGDPHVTNIIDKAEYLYGIDINSLAAKGISAHPATARDISFFETEYVLVNSPGQSPYSLEDIATVRIANPFKGQAFDDSRRIRKNHEKLEKHYTFSDTSFNLMKGLVEAEMSKKPVRADIISNDLKTSFTEGQVDRLKDYFERVSRAANQEAVHVKSKDPSNLAITKKIMKQYQAAIKR